MRRTPTLLATLLLLTACGGSDPAGPDPAESPSPLRFRVLNRLPQPEQLNAVSELDGRVLAVGNYGALLVREAGASGWAPRRLPTTAILSDILQVDTQRLLVAASDGLWLSRDSGASWAHVLQGGSFHRLARDGTRAIALGRDLGAFSDDLEDWETAATDPPGLVIDLAFHIPGEAWAITRDAMYKSTDGGRNWSAVGVPPDLGKFEAMSFPNADIGVVSVTTGEIYRTINGADYDLVEDLVPSVVAIRFRSSSLGHLVASDGTVYRSEDRGKTWLEHGVLSGAPAPRALVADAAGALVVVGRKGLVAEGPSTGGALVELSSGLVHDILVVSLWNPQDGLALARSGGDPHVLLRTNDGGIQWEPEASPVAAPVDLEFLGPSLGVILGRGGELLVSRNEGISWTASNPPITGERFATVLLLDEQNWLVGGSGGLVLKTSDGGATWLQGAVPDQGGSIVDLERFPGTGVVLAALGNKVFRSEDMGRSWQATEGFVFSNALHCLDARTVVALSDNIYRSTDQGRSWQEVLAGDRELLAVRFLDAQHGLAVGEHGKVLESRDGGLGWEERQVTSLDFFDVVPRGDGSLLLVGAEGVAVDAQVGPFP